MEPQVPGLACIVMPIVAVPPLTSMSLIVTVCHSFHFVSVMGAVSRLPFTSQNSSYLLWPPPPCVETLSVYLPSGRP